MNIRATGIKELTATPGSAPKDIANAGFERAANAAMGVFRAEIEQRTPVVTGELLAALTTQTVKLDPPGVVSTIYFGGKQGSVAFWLEYGHREVGHKPGLEELGFVNPQPIFRPAFDVSEGEAVEAFEASIEKTVGQIYPSVGVA